MEFDQDTANKMQEEIKMQDVDTKIASNSQDDGAMLSEERVPEQQNQLSSHQEEFWSLLVFTVVNHAQVPQTVRFSFQHQYLPN